MWRRWLRRHRSSEISQRRTTLGLGRNMRQAIDAGYVAQDRGRRWFADLAEGPFYASFTLVIVICSR